MSNPPQHPLGGLCIGIVLTDGFEQSEMTVAQRTRGTSDDIPSSAGEGG